MTNTAKQCARIVGVIVLAVAFLIVSLVTLQTKSSLQAAPLKSTPSVGNDILTNSNARHIVLNLESCVCSGTWISETVDSAGSRGGITSLALAPAAPHTPYMSYRYVIGGDEYYLRFAWRSGTGWFSQTLGYGGDRSSLALVPAPPYTPCISHNYLWDTLLKFVYKDSISWTTEIVWSHAANDSSLALEPTYPYTPHISYYDPYGTIATLYHAYFVSRDWMSGPGWAHEPVEPYLSGAGMGSSLALDPTDPHTPHISYYDTPNGELKHAWKSETTWLTEIVDVVGDADAYNYTSLALDPTDPYTPHSSYYDYAHHDLKHAWRSGTTWFIETVDSVGDVGLHASMALDRNGNPHVSYYDVTNKNLKYACYDGAVWITQTVDGKSEVAVGEASSLVVDETVCPHISYYDATNRTFKYAYLQRVNYLPVIFKDY